MLKLIYLRLAYGYRRAVIGLLQSVLFKSPQSPRRIVVHRVGAFGDCVVALPAISMIRSYYPHAEIDLVSTQAVGVTIKDLMAEGEVVDHIHVFAKGDRRAALELIKQGDYDLYIEIPQNLNLIKSIRNMLYVRYGAGIPSALGWDAGRIKRFLPLQKQRLGIPREVDRFLNSMTRAGMAGDYSYPLAVDDQHQQRAAELISSSDKRRIAFIIGGKLQAKKWPLAYWRELAETLQDEADVYLIGGPDEQRDAEVICQSETRIHNLCGRSSILETAALLSEMDMAISQDTGAMHLAYAVNTPLVAMFSTRDLTNKWHPPAVSSVVLERVLPCSFCFKSDCENNICMTGITVDDVLQAKHELEQKLTQL